MSKPLLELRIEVDDYGAVRLKILTLVHAEKDSHTMREALSVPLDIRELLRIVERSR